MKKIQLTRGMETLVSDSDYEQLSKNKWCSLPGNRTVYAKRKSSDGKTVFMHRQLMNPPKGMCVDHVDGNGLNNQRDNLRIVTYRENNQHLIRCIKNKTSKFKGVCFVKNRWIASISSPKKRHIRSFKTELEAAIAYNEQAVIHFGKHASINQI